VRSDCRVTVWESATPGPPHWKLTSKVAALYGDSIRADALSALAALDAADLSIQIEDSGALPFTLLARIETAVRRLRPQTVAVVLPPQNPAALRAAPPTQLRRTRLYLPGVTPKLFINAGLYGADAIILDLEDSVPPGEKDAAQILVRNALRSVDFYGAEKMVRVNQLPAGLAEMALLATHGVHTFVLPKIEQATEIVDAAVLLDQMQQTHGVDIKLAPIIESAAGVLNAAEIARASKRVVALAIGLEDYVTDIGARRTLGGRESEWACSQVLNAARAAGVQPLASVFAGVADEAGLREWALEMRRRGFEGIGCLHPSQVAIVNQVYTPAGHEIDEAAAIVAAYEQGLAQGSGATALAGRMIDAPIVKRARRILALAQAGSQATPLETP
jgi:citrate lyase subunit beta/citryl-CoA lyase